MRHPGAPLYAPYMDSAPQALSNLYGPLIIFRPVHSEANPVSDVIFLVGGLALFLAGIAYSHACENL